MVQKILWPEIGALQGRTHGTEKLENDENDGKKSISEHVWPLKLIKGPRYANL